MTIDFDGCTLVERAHLNGSEWFGYSCQCVEYPRLQRIDRYDRRTRFLTSQWAVDGKPVADLDAARVRLLQPPQISAEEFAFLQRIPFEFVRRSSIPGYDDQSGFPLFYLFALRNVGLVEAHAGLVRRTKSRFVVAEVSK